MLNFKGFKKSAEDSSTATLTHEAGHTIKVAKAALTPQLRKHLERLPLHQAAGGELGDKEDFSDNQQGGQAPVVVNVNGGATAGMTPQQQAAMAAPVAIPPTAKVPGPVDPRSIMGTPLIPEEQAKMDAGAKGLSSNPVHPGDTPTGIPGYTPPPDPSEQFAGMPGGVELAQAAQTKAGAESAEGQRIAAAEHANLVQQESLKQQLVRGLTDKGNEVQAAVDDIRANHIRPNAYLEDMSVGGKIATAIGLIAGGIGGGQLGQANPALTFLNSQIDRNLNAQKANMENKHNLLSALEHQYGDQMVAANMFKAINTDLLANQVAEAHAKAATPLAKANLQATFGQLKQQAGQYKLQAQLSEMKGAAQQSGDPVDPGNAVDQKAQEYLQKARVYDPKGAEEFEKRYVPGVGVANVPLEPKDRELLQKKSELKALLDRAKEHVNKGVPGIGLLPGTDAYNEAKSIQEQMTLRMGELADLSRFTPEEAKIYRQAVPDLAGTHFSNKDATKLSQLAASNNDSLNTFYKQKGIGRTAGDTDKVTVISPSGQSGSIPQSQLKKALSMGYKQN